MTQPAYSQGVAITGTAWPWSPTGPQNATELDLINSKIRLILFTFKGTHKMEPTFGSILLALVFENRGPVLATMADIEIKNALSQWLPDVRVEEVIVTDERTTAVPEGFVNIDVKYEWLGQKNTWSGSVNTTQTTGQGT
jgi:phage baseplate assembly protein W